MGFPLWTSLTPYKFIKFDVTELISLHLIIGEEQAYHNTQQGTE